MRKHTTLRSIFPYSFLNSGRTAMAVLLAFALPICGVAQVAAWNFAGAAGNEVSINATTADANLTVSPITRGAGINPSALANSFSANQWAATSLADAVSLAEYFQFSVSPQTGYEASLSTLNANFRRSSNGPNTFQWQYSLDGFATAGVNVGSQISYTGTQTDGQAQPQIDLSVIAALQNIQAGTTVTFRLYGWGASAGTGTFALGRLTGNDLAVGGTVSAVSANTSVYFLTASNTVSESDGSVDITVLISSPSATEATSVLVALTSGDNTFVNGFISETVVFPAGSSDPQVVTLTLIDDDECMGNQVLTFGMENVSGGQGTPTVGTPSTHTLTILDDDQAQGVQLARQYFAGSGFDNWTITTGAGNISTEQGGGDTPPNQRILSAPASWQVSNATATLELGTIFPNEWEAMVVRARVASLSTTTGNGHEEDDQVRFFVNIDGGGYPATADITITGVGLGASAGNARWGFSTGTGVASTMAGTPATFTPSSGGNQTTEGYSYVEIYVPAGAQSISLRVIANNNAAAEVWAIDNIEITGSACASTFYSEASGNVNDPIWSNFPGGPPGPALINEAANIVIQDGFTVTTTANTNVSNLTVETGGTLVVNDNVGLVVHGTSVIIDGTLDTDLGTLALVGTGATSFSTTAPLDLYNLTVNTPNGTTLTGTLDIRGTLQIVQGNFNATGATVTLISNADGTGRLGEVSGSYTGDMTVQRHIPGGATNWRLLGSPVAGATVDQWKDDFITAGFPGSHFPDFFDPPNSGIYWPSIRWYDETVASAEVNDGLVGVASNLSPLEQGRGYAAWSGDTMGTTQPFLVDVTGPPHVAQTPISLPVSYTDSGNPTVDGYNLVSNPLPSAIDFTQIQRGTDVQNAYYLYDPATGNNLAWANGFGIGAANGIIQSSQGFWLKAEGPDATASVHESAKVNVLQGGAFGGLEQPNVPMVRLTVSSTINSYIDESLIVFDLGTPARDADDVLKFVFAHPAAPQIATRSSDGHDMQIDFFGSYDSDISIPVTVQVAVSGDYTLSAALLGMSGLSCVSLEDLTTGTITPLNDGATYTFEIDEEDDWNTPRFVLHATAPMEFHTTDILCGGDANGMATLEMSGDPLTVTWMDAFGTTIDEVPNATGTIILEDLAAGAYMVSVAGTPTVCGTLVENFVIDAPFVLEAEVVEMSEATCEDAADGHLAVAALGGVGPYEFLWSNGETGEGIDGAPGTYSLTITDAHGCTWNSDDLIIGLSEDAPMAGFDMGGNEHEVNTTVEFTNTSVNAESYYWTFGDGGISEEAEPAHVYGQPGIYTVTLIAEAGGCTSIYSEDVTIMLGTSISEAIPFRPNNAWVQGNDIMVEHAFNNGQEVTIEVLDATGRIHLTRNEAGQPALITIPAHTLPTGIWFVRLTNGDTQESYRVPLIR